MKIILFILLASLLSASALAQDAHMVLLAVTETGNTYEGSTADLYLSVQPGSGRVFIETYPLTKIDTQVSTRFAKDVACTFYGKDCDRYDFFYTIKAGDAIIGGPSAGAASAVLTAALLEGSKINESVAMTGTINSGGLIGPVGGIVQKLEAASDSGIKTVLIPKGERFAEQNNETVDLVQYGKEMGLDVIEVGRLSEAMPYFTGKKYPELPSSVDVDETYSEIMKELADNLCSRSENLSKYAIGNTSFVHVAQNLTNQSKADYEKGNYYSAASFCFGANINYNYVILSAGNYSEKEIARRLYETRNATDQFERSLPQYKTFTDIQSYSIILERLDEARDYVSAGLQFLSNGSVEDAVYDLAYAKERLNSAGLWSHFLGRGNGNFDLSSDAMRTSCSGKIAQAEERYEYAKLFFPEQLLDKESLDKAYDELANGRYEVCLFQASKAIASTNVIVGLIGVKEESVPDILADKLLAARESIVRQTEKGLFPLAGYSYYEYASSLGASDVYSALQYAEYSVELSNLDLYFEKNQGNSSINVLDDKVLYLAFFAGGLLVGFSLYAFIARHSAKKKKIIVKKKRF
jgi:uncharacterized protein